MFLFLTVYGFGALSTTQTIPFLKQYNVTEIQQGFILASIALFTILTQIITGILCDKTGRIKIFFLAVFLCSVLLSCWLYFFFEEGFWLLLASVGLIGGAARCIQSLLDTWALEVESQKENFEKFKAIGSVGWALGAWAGAVVCAWFSMKVLAVFCAAAGVFSLVLSFRVEDGRKKSTMKLSQIKELLQNKEYVLLVGIMLVLFAMGCADIYLVVNKIMTLGGTSFHIGLKWGIQSLAEAPVFLYCNRLLKRFKMIPLLVFSTIMFGVRFLVYSFTQNIWLLVIEALFQSVTFPIAVYCTKIGIDQCISEEIKATGQLAGASVYMGVSLLVMPVLTQVLSSVFSQDIALIVVSSFSLIALCLTGVYRKIIS